MAETPDPEFETVFEIVRLRYGARLTPEQLEDLRKIVRARVEGARALRAIRLTNADEPFQRFEPYREDDRPHPALSPQGRGR